MSTRKLTPAVVLATAALLGLCLPKGYADEKWWAKQLPDFISPSADPVAVAFSPDGRLLATPDGGNNVKLWGIAERR